MRSRSWLIGLVVLVSAGTSSADGSHVLAANGVEMVAPSGWSRVAPAPSGITDPVTVLVGGTRGVRFRLVPCQVAAYRIPARGAAVVVVRWRTETSGGGSPDRSRAPLRHIVLNRRGFECWPRHRGGAVQLALRGHAYQVNVLIADRASRRVVAQALSVARSFDLVH